MARPIFAPSDHFENNDPELCYCRGFEQGAHALINLIGMGARHEEIERWLKQVQRWRMEAGRAANEGRPVVRVLPPYPTREP